MICRKCGNKTMSVSLTWTSSNGRTIHRATKTVSKDLRPLQGVHQWLQSQSLPRSQCLLITAHPPPPHGHQSLLPRHPGGQVVTPVLYQNYPALHAGPAEPNINSPLNTHAAKFWKYTQPWELAMKLFKAGLPPRAPTGYLACLLELSLFSPQMVSPFFGFCTEN